MKINYFINIIFSIFFINVQTYCQYDIQTIDKTEVKITDGFWSFRLYMNHYNTLPHILNHIQGPGFLQNFRTAGGFEEGDFVKGTRNASDDVKVFKYLEAIAHSGMLFNDKKALNLTDAVWDTILAAQQPDGYLCTRFILGEKERKLNRIGTGYQVYIAGHFIEAAIAQYEATKSRKALDAAIKFVDLIDSVVGPEESKIRDVPGHQEIELALIKLYRVTQNEKYFNLSKFFIEERGKIDHRPSYGIRNQDHKQLLKHEEAVGHAVRATYSYCAMTDIAAITKEKDYYSAINRLWDNIVSAKLYFTGAIASRYKFPSESFGNDYELPNREAYAETCGNIGFILWNWRLFQLTGDKKYIDVLERALYNALLAGISLEGNKFSYCNPLEYDPEWNTPLNTIKREPWRGVPCCPPNIARLIPQIPEYIYATKDNSIFINLFINSSAEFHLTNNNIAITQESIYPWDGHIDIRVKPEKVTNFSLLIRIPGWAQNRPVPSDLYEYLDPIRSKVQLSINDKKISVKESDGYIIINRKWKKGDKITLDLPMEIRRVISNSKVIENKNKIALERGPIVFCLEEVDNNSVLDIYLPDTSELSYTFKKDMLNGCGIITGAGFKIDKYLKEEELKFQGKVIAIPYYAWQNRGLKEMVVWINRLK